MSSDEFFARYKRVDIIDDELLDIVLDTYTDEGVGI